MTSKKISFTAIHKAELVEGELRELNENEVLTEMEYTIVSGGTEPPWEPYLIGER